MSRKKPRSPGISLRGRAAGPHHYDDEIEWDGGKTKLRRRVRRIGKAAWRRELANNPH